MGNLTERGMMVVIYGPNNLGKSEQIGRLTKALSREGVPVKQIKYPIYDLEPTGPQINGILRLGQPSTEENLQGLFVQNRRDYEPQLLRDLSSGLWVTAEDYKGTGIAWGVTKGVSLKRLEEMNAGLREEDLAILLYGDRFGTGHEMHHRHEGDPEIWNRAMEVHLMLAERYNWQKVFANRPAIDIHNEVMALVKEELLKK